MFNLFKEYRQACEMIGFSTAKHDIDAVEKYSKEANEIYETIRRRHNDAAMTVLNLLTKD